MTEKTHQTPKTRIFASIAVAGAIIGALSLNQVGLTGRATGGTVGCGGMAPVEAESVSQDASGLGVVPVLGGFGQRVNLKVQSLANDVRPIVPDDQLAMRVLENEDGRPATLEERLLKSGHHHFLQWVEDAGMLDVFRDPQTRVTLFVPTDAAIEAHSAEEIAFFEDPQNRAFLQALVQHHLAVGRFAFGQPPGQQVQTSLAGQPLSLDVGEMTVEAATGIRAHVEVANLQTDESMVHVVDRVLVPEPSLPVVTLHQSHQLFYAILLNTGLIEDVADLGRQMSVLAPTDAALRAQGVDVYNIDDPANRKWLTQMARSHLFMGEHPSAFRESFAGVPVEWEPGENKLRFPSGQEVALGPSHPAANGTVYRADTVMVMAP